MSGIPAFAPLRSGDPHDLRLREAVHPPGWRNPRPAGRYHLVVLGAGTAGLVTAAIAAGLGARVALVERALMGGDCLNAGCVPSKALLAAARGWRAAREAEARFGGPAVSGEGSFAAAMERMRRIRADLAPVDGAPRFAGLGVDVFLGAGRFVSDDAVEVAGARLAFRRAVVATGARPAVPEVPGLEAAGYLTSETIFALAALPERLAVLGGGAVGCELAQAFARFGTRVTLLETAPRILPDDDPEAAVVVAAALECDGVRIATGAELTRVEREGGETRLHLQLAGAKETVMATHLLVATGRRANVEGMGLEAAGIEHDAERIATDPRMRTSNPRVYAIGDVASSLRFTHAADAQARMVVRNALFFGRGRKDAQVVPRCTYTDPELAHVGPGAAALAARNDLETVTVPFAEVDRARLEGREEGFLRVHLERGSDRIVAATVVGEHAGELIALAAHAIDRREGLAALGSAVLPYPTRAEAFRKAADRHRRGRLTPRVKGAFSLYFRLLGG